MVGQGSDGRRSASDAGPGESSSFDTPRFAVDNEYDSFHLDAVRRPGPGMLAQTVSRGAGTIE
jgi:hypothetical protein